MAAGGGGNPNRQRMINLMYLVFIAMMALNISPDVLDSFTRVESQLRQVTASTEKENERLRDQMQQALAENPKKVAQWNARSEQLHQAADSLFNYVQSLKLLILQEADGKQATNLSAIKNPDNQSAASIVLLSPINPRGRDLKRAIERFRGRITELLSSEQARQEVAGRLVTTGTKAGKSWEQETFESMPAIAAITTLTNIQNSVRYVEGLTLTELLQSIDYHDYRSNRLTAAVIPESRLVMRGMPFKAQIVLGSIDTTKHPQIFIGGRELSPSADGRISLGTSSVGTFPIKGTIRAQLGDGTIATSSFESSYTVIEPSATVAPTLMNILYAGIDNPLRIAAPGFPSEDLVAVASSGTLTRSGGLWHIRPSQPGTSIKITVSAKQPDGRNLTLGESELKVRALPDPSPYLAIGSQRFKGGRIARSGILASGGVKAAIDDAILDIAYSVKSFQLIAFDSMGNAIPETSHSGSFSDRQIRLIQSAPRGRRLYLTEIIAQGPDGISRRIPSLELIIQ